MDVPPPAPFSLFDECTFTVLIAQRTLTLLGILICVALGNIFLAPDSYLMSALLPWTLTLLGILTCVALGNIFHVPDSYSMSAPLPFDSSMDVDVIRYSNMCGLG